MPITNVRLRDEIERLLSRSPGHLDPSKHDLVVNLPPAAAQETLEMVERFANYRAALHQALPESPQAMSEQDASTMLETVRPALDLFRTRADGIVFRCRRVAG